jgi:hypothetical protein
MFLGADQWREETDKDGRDRFIKVNSVVAMREHLDVYWAKSI